MLLPNFTLNDRCPEMRIGAFSPLQSISLPTSGTGLQPLMALWSATSWV